MDEKSPLLTSQDTGEAVKPPPYEEPVAPGEALLGRIVPVAFNKICFDR